MPDLQTFEVKGVEIFGAGRHNGDEFTEKDLDALVDAHSKIGGEIKPFLKLGHDEGQRLLQDDGYPAAGWLTGLRRVGKKLVADFSGIPAKIRDLMESKSYGRFSAEIYFDLLHKGTNFPRVLKAVAMLGSDTPAVKNLDDFINLFGEGYQPAMAYIANDTVTRNYEDVVSPEEERMPDLSPDMQAVIKNLQDQLAELNQKVAELQSKNQTDATANAEALAKAAEDTKGAQAETVKVSGELEVARKGEKDAVVAAEAVLTEATIAKNSAEVTSAVSAAVAGGKITPVQVALFTALANSEHLKADEKGGRVLKYTEGKEEKELKFMSPKELVMQVIESLPVIAEFADASKKKAAPSLDTVNSDEPTDEDVQKYIETEGKQNRKVSYSQAVKDVARLSKGA